MTTPDAFHIWQYSHISKCLRTATSAWVSPVSTEGCDEELCSDRLQYGTGPFSSSAHGVGTGVTPSACDSCGCSAGDVRSGFQQRQHFSLMSSHYLDRRREKKPGAAGSGLGDLVGGIFPSNSAAHKLLGREIRALHCCRCCYFNDIPSLLLVVTQDPA